MNKRTRESRNRKTKRTRKPKKIVRENLERTEIEEQEVEKENIANLTNKLSIILKEILLLHFLESVKQLIKKAKEKEAPEKCIRVTKILKDVIIKKEVEKKVDAYEKN